jgi:hypothetical protein
LGLKIYHLATLVTAQKIDSRNRHRCQFSAQFCCKHSSAADVEQGCFFANLFSEVHKEHNQRFMEDFSALQHMLLSSLNGQNRSAINSKLNGP